MYKTPISDAIRIIELELLRKGQIYPVTIVKDRYDGTYSNAKWLALPTDPGQVPDEIGGSDPEEMIFWREFKEAEFPIGKGESPDEALKDLIEKAIKYYESK